MDQVFVQIRFSEETDHGQYNDALYFPLEEYDSLSEEDIQQLKQDRIDHWIDTIEHPKDPSTEEVVE